jgi:hypothetical protein
VTKTARKPVTKTVKASKPIVGRVFYDYAQGKLGIQYQSRRGAYGEPEYLTRVVLRKAKVIILQGRPEEYDGPENAPRYGTMGFLVGEVAPETTRITCGNLAVVQWNGLTFQSVNEPHLHEGEGRTVNEMATCFVIAGDDPIILASGIK